MPVSKMVVRKEVRSSYLPKSLNSPSVVVDPHRFTKISFPLSQPQSFITLRTGNHPLSSRTSLPRPQSRCCFCPVCAHLLVNEPWLPSVEVGSCSKWLRDDASQRVRSGNRSASSAGHDRRDEQSKARQPTSCYVRASLTWVVYSVCGCWCCSTCADMEGHAAVHRAIICNGVRPFWDLCSFSSTRDAQLLPRSKPIPRSFFPHAEREQETGLVGLQSWHFFLFKSSHHPPGLDGSSRTNLH